MPTKLKNLKIKRVALVDEGKSGRTRPIRQEQGCSA
jgi:hypothetical protein